jgi:PAS domain-containing protein
VRQKRLLPCVLLSANIVLMLSLATTGINPICYYGCNRVNGLRRMANPPRAGEKARVQTSLRLKASLFQELRNRAKESGESINAQIEALVANSLGAANQLPGDELGPAKYDRASMPPYQGTPTVAEGENQDAPSKYWRLRQFLRWLPIAALIRDLDGRTVLANEELRRVVGRKEVVKLKPSQYWESPAAAWIEAHDQFVRETNASILCIERIPIRNTVQERLAVRFPIRDTSGRVTMTGALSFDLGQLRATEILNPRDKGRRPCRMPLVFSSDYAEAAADSLLSDFVHWVPAIAVAKDPCGHLLSVNHRFYSVTGKGAEVIGRLPCENWPEGTADLITAHDQLVRETGAPFLSVEKIPTNRGYCERLNLRFPMFGSHGEIEMTGVLGFDYGLMQTAIETLSKSGAYSTVCMFEPEQDESTRFMQVEPNYSESGSDAGEWVRVGTNT